MPKYAKTKREEARKLYLTGECESVAEVARRLEIKPHTVGQWRREEDWEALRLKIDKQAAEKLVQKIANDRVKLNETHHKLWSLVVSKLFESLQSQGRIEVRDLSQVAGILDRAQKGQRLARGLSIDGKTEEQLRAESEADIKAYIDLFIDVVKSEITDELARDRIARAILERVPVHEEELG